MGTDDVRDRMRAGSAGESTGRSTPVSSRVRKRAEPLARPTTENLVTATLAIIVAVLYVVCGLYRPIRLAVTFPLLPYFVLLALGAWRVRPKRGRGFAFHLWFTPVVLQVCIYGIMLSRMALLYGQGVSYPLRDPLVDRLAVISAVLFFGVWLPTIALSVCARRGGWLLAAQALGPLVTVLWMVLMIDLLL